jgi:tetratricopeptide (TPR) repeat protein
VFIWAAKCRDIPDTSRNNSSHRKIDMSDEREFENSLAEQGEAQLCLSSHATSLTHLLDDNTLINSDNAALCLTRAYYHFQQRQLPDAIKYCRQSLKYDSKYSPAWRCIALIEWSQGQRPQAIDHLRKSLKFFAMNPFCLRSAAIANAIMGNFQEAVHMIQAAVEIGGMTHALSWRAAGQITYLYDKREPTAGGGGGGGDKTTLKAISYLQQAFKLSNELDFEAGRLLGQVSTLLCVPLITSLCLSLCLCLCLLRCTWSLVSSQTRFRSCGRSCHSSHAILLL